MTTMKEKLEKVLKTEEVKKKEKTKKILTDMKQGKTHPRGDRHTREEARIKRMAHLPTGLFLENFGLTRRNFANPNSKLSSDS